MLTYSLKESFRIYEAIQYNFIEDIPKIKDFIQSQVFLNYDDQTSLYIPSLSIRSTINLSDWIIKDSGWNVRGMTDTEFQSIYQLNN